MNNYAAGGAALQDSGYLTRPEKWLARKRYDLIVAQDLARGSQQSSEVLVARAAYEGAVGLAIAATPVLSVLFVAAVFLGPETDNYVPLQAAFGGVALVIFVGCHLRGRAARRHFNPGT